MHSLISQDLSFSKAWIVRDNEMKEKSASEESSDKTGLQLLRF